MWCGYYHVNIDRFPYITKICKCCKCDASLYPVTQRATHATIDYLKEKQYQPTGNKETHGDSVKQILIGLKVANEN